jgi:hypothetical protein
MTPSRLPLIAGPTYSAEVTSIPLGEALPECRYCLFMDDRWRAVLTPASTAAVREVDHVQEWFRARVHDHVDRTSPSVAAVRAIQAVAPVPAAAA